MKEWDVLRKLIKLIKKSTRTFFNEQTRMIQNLFLYLPQYLYLFVLRLSLSSMSRYPIEQIIGCHCMVHLASNVP